MVQTCLVWLAVFTTSSDPSAAGPVYRLSVDGTPLHEDRMSFMVEPGGTLLLECDGEVSWSFSAGDPSSVSGSSATWTAPRGHGVFDLTVSSDRGVQGYTILIPVESCRWRTPTLNSFPIGYYGDGNTREHIPGSFVELDRASSGARLSTHLVLGEFLGHIEGEYPQYIVLDLALVDKLEALLAEIAPSYPEPLDIHVMSGFRTPAYNRDIGNETDFSMHLYGKAADIWVEGFPPNNLMDDIDRNKRIDFSDGEMLVDAVRRIEAGGSVSVGGTASYRWTPQHGPFVHIDVRGRPAVWQTQRNLVPDPVI